MPANNVKIISYDKFSTSSSSSDEEYSSYRKVDSSDDEGIQFVVHFDEKDEEVVHFESLPRRDRHENFLKRCTDIMLKEAVFEATRRQNKVTNFKTPEELTSQFDFELSSKPASHDKLVKIVRDTISYSVKTGHPYFVNQLFSSLDPYGLVGQWLTDALNPSVYTYEVSPVFTLMEETVLREMRKIVGFEGGRGDGIFCPGGSMANGYAISCARYKLFPEVKTKGLHSLPRLVLYTSEDAHYSVKKMASFEGIGSDNVYLIKTDKRGKMDVKDLQDQVKRTIKEGGVPFLVSATAGTTVLGAFDPLKEIADLCQKYKLWLHVDAAWGGGALMSQKHRHLLEGIERADSVTWNPHKLLTAPQQCSTFLLKHEGLLAEVHGTGAAYLFQKDKFYDTKYDTGDKHIQCGRRADVLKFWFMWKAKGTTGLTQHIEKVFENAAYFTETIRNRLGFQLVNHAPECTNICFWYIPKSLRDAKSEENYNERLHLVAPAMKERMMKEGTMMVTYQSQKGLPNFFRIVFQNSGLDKSDMVHLVEEFERLGANL
ncbi:cysteine sulfinic acid decarboxylase [Coccinella septempunctata]|uniref:cysteine sulfinic acid decarboxylase n=1 Tax=Coccinella septempunctata TaxID=41139 RepID=UPI001D074B9C|nr:cysteine sulfinic acid decarboxylase [Coccinella septempunctata]